MVGTTSFLKLNTKQDFINNYNARIANGDSDPLQDYVKLYETRLNWFTELDGEGSPVTVASIEDGVTDDSHRVTTEGTEEEPIFHQQELIVDPNGLYALKGFTVEELETILDL
jgi:hypothetical protein